VNLFRILHDERLGELSYLLADPVAREALLIDPHSRDLPVLSAMLGEGGLRLRWVLRTHGHDSAMPGELERLLTLKAPVVQGLVGPGARRPEPDECLPFGGERIQVLETPGHTAHCLSFVWRDRVFCGGLLAGLTCPHQPLPDDPGAMWDSVTQRLFTLPDETLLFSAHARRARAVGTVLEARHWHPWFARRSRDGFLSHVARLRERAEAAHWSLPSLTPLPTP
jgi:glyoxylase-like metal-dependent hydrolase (beta-lactamase superfamily II)